jgi:class 3 adenylate cyclase
VPVYRIDQTHRTRVLENQYIVVTDLRRFLAFTESHSMAAVEKVLDHLLEVVGRVCREFGGTNRFAYGDAYCLTFPDPGAALEAVERLYEAWSHVQQRDEYRCPINVVVHKGTLNLFRSYLFGQDVNDAMTIESLTKPLGESGRVFVSSRVRDDLADAPWAARLQPVELAGPPRSLAGIVVCRLV